jgi:hypothetical protein
VNLAWLLYLLTDIFKIPNSFNIKISFIRMCDGFVQELYFCCNIFLMEFCWCDILYAFLLTMYLHAFYHLWMEEILLFSGVPQLVKYMHFECGVEWEKATPMLFLQYLKWKLSVFLLFLLGCAQLWILSCLVCLVVRSLLFCGSCLVVLY